MRVCLINPFIHCFPRDMAPIVAPMGLACIAATLEQAGHEVFVFDITLGGKTGVTTRDADGQLLVRYGYDAEEMSSQLKAFDPEVVGISNNMAVNEEEALECADIVKSVCSGVPVVFGGINATARAEKILGYPSVDYLIAGEGDFIFPELLRRLISVEAVHDIPEVGYKNDHQVVLNRSLGFVKNLDELPDPAWHLLDMQGYLDVPFPFPAIRKRNAIMLTSRGCVNNCVFCSGKKLLGRWRARSIERVRDELRMLKHKYGIQSVHFMDANINASPKRFESLCTMLEEEGVPWNPIGGLFIRQLSVRLTERMLQSGCFYMTLAVEHGCSDIQEYIGKHAALQKVRDIVRVAHSRGVWTHASFIVGFPGETKRQAMENLEYAMQSGVDSISVFTATPLPGSKMFGEVSQYMELGPGDMRFLTNKSYSRVLTVEQIERIKKRIYSSFVRNKVRQILLHPVEHMRRVLVGREKVFKILFQSFRRYLLLRFY